MLTNLLFKAPLNWPQNNRDNGSIMMIHVYSLIYILLLHLPVLIERIVDLCFFVRLCAWHTSWRNQFAAHLLILRADSPAGVLTVIRRVVSPFFTMKQTSVEISIVDFSFTFLSSQACLNRSFFSSHWMFLWNTWVWSCFSQKGGRERLYSKNRDINSSLTLHRDIENKIDECITIGRGEEEGLQTPKT